MYGKAKKQYTLIRGAFHHHQNEHKQSCVQSLCASHNSAKRRIERFKQLTGAAAMIHSRRPHLGLGCSRAAGMEGGAAGAAAAAGALARPGAAKRLGPIWGCQVGRALEEGSQEMSDDLLRSRSLLRSRVAILESEAAGLSFLH